MGVPGRVLGARGDGQREQEPRLLWEDPHVLQRRGKCRPETRRALCREAASRTAAWDSISHGHGPVAFMSPRSQEEAHWAGSAFPRRERSI